MHASKSLMEANGSFLDANDCSLLLLLAKGDRTRTLSLAYRTSVRDSLVLLILVRCRFLLEEASRELEMTMCGGRINRRWRLLLLLEEVVKPPRTCLFLLLWWLFLLLAPPSGRQVVVEAMTTRRRKTRLHHQFCFIMTW